MKTTTKTFFPPHFLEECVEKYAKYDVFPPHAMRVFIPKFMNIVDPLRDYNNLGRSVSKNSHLRIRRAFTKGAKSIRSIIFGNSVQSERILSVLFANTCSHFSILEDELRSAGEMQSTPTKHNGKNHLDMALSPPSPNWIRSNKVFDSKLEDCRKSLLNAAIHTKGMQPNGTTSEDTFFEESGMNGTEGTSAEASSRESSRGSRNKRRNSSRGKTSNSGSSTHNASSNFEQQQQPEKPRRSNASGKSSSSNSKKPPQSGKSRKLRTSTLSDYINLESVTSPGKNKARKQKTTPPKKKSTTKKESSSKNVEHHSPESSTSSSAAAPAT
jgi:hypothetical protein